ncbi:hypothetical protein AgCh_035457 [Apium graveolens]
MMWYVGQRWRRRSDSRYIEAIPGYVKLEFALALAVKEALAWNKENKWEIMVIELDCLVVVQEIRSKVGMHSPFADIIMVCRKLVTALNIALLSANMDAQLIARSRVHFKVESLMGGLSPSL